MGRKKIVLAAVLLVVIVVGVVITVKRTTSGSPQPPAWLMDQKIDRIDLKTLEVMTERFGDWQGKYAPDKSCHYKSPKTGEYTMVDVMTCMACGRPIPAPEMRPPQMQPPIEPQGKDKHPIGALDTPPPPPDYKCPRCGKSAFGRR